jgi:hypothetical protein
MSEFRCGTEIPSEIFRAPNGSGGAFLPTSGLQYVPGNSRWRFRSNFSFATLFLEFIRAAAVSNFANFSVYKSGPGIRLPTSLDWFRESGVKGTRRAEKKRAETEWNGNKNKIKDCVKVKIVANLFDGVFIALEWRGARCKLFFRPKFALVLFT